MAAESAGWRGVWTLGESRGGEIGSVSFELLAWGRALADKLGVELASVVLGSGVSARAETLIHHGADKVYLVDNPGLAHFTPDAHARVLESLVGEFRPEIFIASATTYGRTVMPYLAARLGTGLTADCTELDIEEGTGLLIQRRPAIGGNVMATIKTPAHRPQMATVRPKSRRPLPADPGRRGSVIAREYPEETYRSSVRVLGFHRDESASIPLQEADVVVSGGKGLRDAKNFKLLEELAGLLGGVVGASRSAVDAGWIGYPHQVGLSGKTVSPRLYLAAGISGAVQHVAGMSSAETVVAINLDPEAAIFRVSDLGVVGDALEILPELVRLLRDHRQQSAAKGGA